MTDYPRIQVEDDRVILRGEWVEEAIHDVTFSMTDNIDEFEGLFEIVKGDHVANQDYYQGMNLMALIRRKADGRVFGYPYWKGGGKYGESMSEPNGEEHGLEIKYPESTEVDWDAVYEEQAAYVWLPAEPYPVEYWRIVK